ncbi:MAG: InlB B-repeat-containing protein [Candidatus Methanomethylophilaceae archaeon]
MNKMKKQMMAVMAVALTLCVLFAPIVESDAAESGSYRLAIRAEPAISGITFNAVSEGHDPVTGTTASDGSVVLELAINTIWTITGQGFTHEGVEYASAVRCHQSTEAGSTLVMDIPFHEKFSYTIVYDSRLMTSEAESPISYGGSSADLTPISNVKDGDTGELRTILEEGSWSFDSSALLNYCFYAVFNTDGTIKGYLNPDNLTEYTDGTSAADDIKVLNVMFCIPTLWTSSTSETYTDETTYTISTLTISNDPSQGEAYAHTIDGWIYEYYGIGVYEGCVSDGKLLSVSGATPTASTTRSTFRGYAQANQVESGHAMLWNYYQWTLYRNICYIMMEDFDSQSLIGRGSVSASSSSKTGLTDTLGPYAGNPIGSTDSVKFLIENAWGSLFEFVDDFVWCSGQMYLGQNSVATDSKTDKISQFTSALTGTSSYSGFVSAIDTSNPISWGWATAFNGSEKIGLTDYNYQYGSGDTTDRLLRVGGYWDNGSCGGVGYADASHTLSSSYTYSGARLAFVFDADAASPSHTVTYMMDSENEYLIQAVEDGQHIIPPENPKKTGFTFAGWFKDAECTVAADFNITVTDDCIFFAKWEESSEPVTPPVDPDDPESPDNPGSSDSLVAKITVTKSSDIEYTWIFDASKSIGYTSEPTWDFGDGTTGTGLYVTHTFESGQSFKVVLTITGEDGSTDTAEYKVSTIDREHIPAWVYLAAIVLIVAIILIIRTVI